MRYRLSVDEQTHGEAEDRNLALDLAVRIASATGKQVTLLNGEHVLCTLDVPRAEREARTVNGCRVELTPRQLDVLRLAERGLTNSEIGAELFVSVNTVKHHLSLAASALDARGRGGAVFEARRIGLL